MASNQSKKRLISAVTSKSGDEVDEVEFLGTVQPPAKVARKENNPTSSQIRNSAATTTNSSNSVNKKQTQEDDKEEKLIQKIGNEKTGELWEVRCSSTWYSRKKEEKEGDEHEEFFASEREALLYAIYMNETEQGHKFNLDEYVDLETNKIREKLPDEPWEDESDGDIYSGSKLYYTKKIGQEKVMKTKELVRRLKNG